MTTRVITDQCLTCTELTKFTSDPSIRQCCHDLEPATCGKFQLRPESASQKGNEPTTDQQTVIKELGEWIDGEAIASAIAEEMVDLGFEPTVADGMTIWLDCLENLHTLIDSAMRYKL